MRKNLEIRNALAKTGMCEWQLADVLGVSESTITRWMRHEMSDAKKAEIIGAIHEYKGRGE